MAEPRTYKLNCTDYVLHEGNDPVGPLLPEVALAFSFDAEEEMWTLYKHGSPSGVQAWVEKQKKAQGGMAGGLAEGLHVLEGMLPVADLNRVLDNNNHIPSLIKNCLAISSGDEMEAGTMKLDGVLFSENHEPVYALIKPPGLTGRSAHQSVDQNDVTDVVAKPRKLSP